jgi:hypothetical protein
VQSGVCQHFMHLETNVNYVGGCPQHKGVMTSKNTQYFGRGPTKQVLHQGNAKNLTMQLSMHWTLYDNIENLLANLLALIRQSP